MILRKTWSVDECPHLVYNLPKGTLKRCGCCGYGEREQELAGTQHLPPVGPTILRLLSPLTRKQELKREVVFSSRQTSYRDKKEVGANRRSPVATVTE